MAPRKQNKESKGKGGGKRAQSGGKMTKMKGKQTKDQKGTLKGSKSEGRSKGTSGAGRVVKRGTGKRKTGQTECVRASTSRGRGRVQGKVAAVKERSTSDSKTSKLKAKQVEKRKNQKNQGQGEKANKTTMKGMKRKRGAEEMERPRKKAKDSHEEPSVAKTQVEVQRDLSPMERLSLEVLCKIIQFLPLRDALKLQCLSRTQREAVRLHLRICKSINFTEGEVCGTMSCKMSDRIFGNLVTRCPDLTNIYGLHPSRLCKPHCKEHAKLVDCLTIKGMVAALKNCQKLKGIETSDIHLLESLLMKLSNIKILGLFKNRGGTFPPPPQQSFCLRQNPPITKLHLTGVILPELPRMDYVIYLALKWVKFTNLNPFREFMAPRLHTFVMNNCSGPTNALKYVPLVTRLAAAANLTRLEMVRVPFLGAFFQHVVEDTWRLGGFRQLKKILISACKHATEIDMGHLLLTAAESISEVYIQPSLTKDSLFLALSMAEPDFPKIDTISLGYVDPFPVEKGKWEPLQLALAGLADAGASEHAALITDVGVQHVGKDFSFVKNLNAYNCPHLINPSDWLTQDGMCFAQLRSLHLNRCHAIKLRSFCEMLAQLPAIETVYLERMFREPPKGCSRVGLSAGTGLGVSSAFVANQEPAPAAAAAAAAPAPAVPPLIPQMNAAPAPPGGGANQVLPVPDILEDELPELSFVKRTQQADVRSDGAGKFEPCSKCFGSVAKKSGLSDSNVDASVGHNPTDNKSCSDNEKFDSDSKKIDSEQGSRWKSGSCGSDDLEMGPKSRSGVETSMVDEVGAEKEVKVKEGGTAGVENGSAVEGNDAVETVVPMESFNGHQIGQGDLDSPSEVRGPNSICGVVPVSAGYTNGARNESRHAKDAAKPAADDETKSCTGKGKRPVGGKAFFKKKTKSSAVPSTSSAQGMDPLVGNLEETDGGTSCVTDSSGSKGDKELQDDKTTHNVKSAELSASGNGVGSRTNEELKSGVMPHVENVAQKEDGNSKKMDSSTLCLESDCVVGTSICKMGEATIPGYSGDEGIGLSEGGISGKEPGYSGESCGALRPGDSNVKIPIKTSKDSTCRESIDSYVKSLEEGSNSNPKSDKLTPTPMDTDDISVKQTEISNKTGENPKNVHNQAVQNEVTKSEKTTSSDKEGSNADQEQINSEVPMASSGSNDVSVRASASASVSASHSPHTCVCSCESKQMAGSSITTSSDATSSRAKSDNHEKIGANSTEISDNSKSKASATTNDSSADVLESTEPVGARKTVGTQTTYNGVGDLHPGPGPSGEHSGPGVPGQPNPAAANPTPRRRDIPVFRCLSDVDDDELEEDTRQVLIINSRTLVSLTLHMVGITDLEIVDSPQIKVLHGTACRVLKNVRLLDAPKINRVTFAQCNKLDHMTVIRDVTRLTPTSDRFIFLRPMAKFDAKCIGEELFRIGNGYHGCMIQDHSLDPGTTQIQKARFIEKIKLVSSISFHILRLDKYPIFPKTFSSEPPWGRNLHDLTGTSPDGSPWEATTDIPWLPHLESLSTKEEDKDAVDIIEEKLGLHKLYSMEHIWPFGCFEGLAEAIGHAEAAESALFPRTIGVYINTCDVSGIPTPDDYV